MVLRDFGAMARFMASAYGEEIARWPLASMGLSANLCIDEDRVPYMDRVMPEEGMRLANAVKAAVDAEARARAIADKRLPVLVGSKAQVRWADEIRRAAIDAADGLRRDALRSGDEIAAQRLQAYASETLRKVACARWFIDNRRDLRRRGDQDAMSGAEARAREEMTIRPADVRHEGCAEIRRKNECLMVSYGKDPDFLRIMRACRLRWDPDAEGWAGRKEWGKVPVTEQISRLAAVLLKEGFAVMVSDDVARAEARVRAGA